MEDLMSLHEQINDFWKLVKANYPVRSNFNVRYWDKVTADINQYANKYPEDSLAKRLVMAYMGFLQNAKKED